MGGSFARQGVALYAPGLGEFPSVVLTAALGGPVTVEPVEWDEQVSLGVAAGPVPPLGPSGGGPMPFTPLLMSVLEGGLVAVRRSRAASPVLRRG